jgi:UDP-glucose 4-epimerase
VIVAASEKIRAALAWVPQHDTLDGIVAQALRWEQRLSSMQAQRAP